MAAVGPFKLSAEFDIPEPRVLKDPLYVSAGGVEDPAKGWDLARSTNVFREPLTGVVMMAPLCTTAAWATTTSGSYARLGAGDYTLTTAAAWIENERGLAGNVYLEALGVNEPVVTSSAYAPDQPWFVSVYVPGVQKLAEQTILECGYGTYASSGIWFRIRANGAVAVYDGSTQISSGTLAFQQSQKSVNLSTVNFMIFPMRAKRGGVDADYGRIVISTDQGGGHVVQLNGIATADPVVAASTFWWNVPIGKASVQVAPIKFETTATLWGPLRPLRYAPALGRTWAGRAFEGRTGPSYGGATAAYNLYRSDRTTIFAATGALNQAVPRVYMTNTAGLSSPYIEAFDAEFEATTTTTYDDPTEVAEILRSVSFSVDDEGRTTCKFTAKLSDLDALGIPKPEIIGDRPFGLSLIDTGDSDARYYFFRGTLHKPVWIPADGAGDGTLDLLEYEGVDRNECFAATSLIEGLPFDDEQVTDGFQYCLRRSGFNPATVAIISSLSLRITPSSGIALGKFARLPERGAKVDDELKKLKDDYVANWITGWIPGDTPDDANGGLYWRAMAPADLPTTPAVTLYESADDAAADGVSAEDAVGKIVLAESLKRYPTPGEANQVIVVTQDDTDAMLYYGQVDDASSQAPNTAPASRPDNWMGFTRRVIDVDPLLQTQANADYAATVLAGRVSVDKHIADFSCGMMMIEGRPLWPTEIVRIVLNGGATYEDFRILEIQNAESLRGFTDAEITAGSREKWEVQYRGERIETGEYTLGGG